MDLKKLFPEEYIHFEMPTSDLYLYADRAQIEQVLINLLKNARETCERRTDKNIEIKFFLKATQHSQYLIMVREFCQMFWIRFSFFLYYQTSSSGIGLSLCKQIMTLHDGSINVKSEIGKGSCFILTIPK